MAQISLQEIDDDDQYIFYSPKKPIQIFGFALDVEECEILISKKLKREEIMPVLTDYLEWLSSCKTELSTYFCSELGEKLPENWFESIEVYNTSIYFDSTKEFGASIEFGECILSDHIVMLEIENFEIVSNGLIG